MEEDFYLHNQFRSDIDEADAINIFSSELDEYLAKIDISQVAKD